MNYSSRSQRIENRTYINRFQNTLRLYKSNIFQINLTS